MSHEVETMAWTNQVPWHGLGVKVNDNLSPNQMLKAAGLNWGVNLTPMTFVSEEGVRHTVSDHFALIRDSDNKVLDVVGNRYQPVQNEAAFEFFADFVHAGDAKMDTAGSLHGGQWVWGLASLGDSFKLANGDHVKGYVLLASPHKQGKSLIAKFTPVRVVCNNTLTLALRSSKSKHAHEFRMGHRNRFDAAMITQAKVTMGIAREQLDEFKANATLLSAKTMNAQDVISTLHPFFQSQTKLADILSDPTKINPRFAAVLDAYTQAPGAQLALGTAWGALNAVTYYFDHMSGKTADTRLAKSWLGRNSIVKEEVLATLLKA